MTVGRDLRVNMMLTKGAKEAHSVWNSATEIRDGVNLEEGDDRVSGVRVSASG